MVKYSGDEVEVRVTTTEAGLDTASALTNVSGVEWHVAQEIEHVPVGLGSRLREPNERLISYSGKLERWHDETAVAGSANFRTAVGAFNQADLTLLYVEIKNKTSGKKVRLRKCKGSYSVPSVKPDGFMLETYDFIFSDIVEV